MENSIFDSSTFFLQILQDCKWGMTIHREAVQNEEKVLTIHKGNKADYKMYECNFEENLCKNCMTFQFLDK